MGLTVELDEDAGDSKPGGSRGMGKLQTAGRPSQFIVGMDVSEESIQEDPNDEYTDTESEPESSQFEMEGDSSSSQDN